MSPIERLNERFALLAVGNTVVVAEFRPDQSIKELWPRNEFKGLLIKERVKVRIGDEDKKVPLADVWLKDKRGRQYDQLVYAMPGGIVTAGERDYNGWHGYTVEPVAGDWSKNKAHVRDVICGGNEAYFEWVWNWLAALVQKPGQHAWAAIVLRGGQGSGKGHFVDKMIGRLFHAQQYSHLLGANQLTAEFNEHLSGKVLIYADESTWGGDKQAASKLKGLVTESNVTIHRKFLKMVEEPSALHIIIASNNEWPIPVEWDDRRFLVLDVNDAKKQNDPYFDELLHELDHGGRAALLFDLLQHPVDWPALRHPPETDAKRDVKGLSLSHEERWLQNWLMNDDGFWKSSVPRQRVYASYRDSFKNGLAPKSVDGLGKFLRRIFLRAGVGKTLFPELDGLPYPRLKKLTIDDELPDGRVVERRVNGWEFPELTTCRTAFDRATGVITEWPKEMP